MISPSGVIPEFLLDRAALYVTGDLPAAEREEFELLLATDEPLRHFTAELAEATSLINHGAITPTQPPSAAVKAALLQRVQETPQHQREGLVRTDAAGLLCWANDAFLEMCGYRLDELTGRKLGPILQGPGSDGATVARMRAAVHDHQHCRETLRNYHKDGTPYLVDIAICPILDDDGELHGFLAREREVAAPTA